MVQQIILAISAQFLNVLHKDDELLKSGRLIWGSVHDSNARSWVGLQVLVWVGAGGKPWGLKRRNVGPGFKVEGVRGGANPWAQ